MEKLLCLKSLLLLSMLCLLITCKKEEIPIVVTNNKPEVSINKAICGGNVTSEGSSPVTQRGVCWSSTNSNPTVTDYKTFNGEGLGDYISTISELNGGTTYFLRAYAVNSSGTGYGNTITFTTLTVPATVADIDGNVYNTVVIGAQIWMKENLKVSKYRNGDAILTGLNNTDWFNTTNGAYAIYDNDNSNNDVYGKLYNFYAVTDTRQLCPLNWHVPTDADWFKLVSFVASEANSTDILSGSWTNSLCGAKLKEAGTAHWLTPNTNTDNETGFTLLPSGFRSADGEYYFIGKFTRMHTSTEYEADWSKVWFIEFNYQGPSIWHYYYGKNNGYPVRCIMD